MNLYSDYTMITYKIIYVYIRIYMLLYVYQYSQYQYLNVISERAIQAENMRKVC